MSFIGGHMVMKDETEARQLAEKRSDFLKQRRSYQPSFPKLLDKISQLSVRLGDSTTSFADSAAETELKTAFPKTFGQPMAYFENEKGTNKSDQEPLGVAVVLSGGQAPGGHNVICGIFDGLSQLDVPTKLWGFCGGPNGILLDNAIEITPGHVHAYINTGGFDMLGSGRTKLESKEHFERCHQVLRERNCQVLVVIGGDDSNTNAALLAEYFSANNIPIRIVGVPKTIDGDLSNEYVETSFGFDTASKLYASLISNIATDALSAKKYYHFIRLMGRAASHITLEAALQTQPNVTLISEEVSEHNWSLSQVVETLVETIVDRAQEGKNYGIILVPEGIVEAISEIKTLITDINKILADHGAHFNSLNGFTQKGEYLNQKLNRDSSYTFSGLPVDIQRQLIMDRDPHGNVQVSRIETEKLLIDLVELRLAELKSEGKYQGKFSYQHHFLGYEGRCCAPSNFDADYGYALGRTAVALADSGLNGYMAVVRNLASPRMEWEPMGCPLTAMMTLELRKGTRKPVIKKTLVNTKGHAFARLREHRKSWAQEDHYRFAGGIQYFGPSELVDIAPVSLEIERTAP